MAAPAMNCLFVEDDDPLLFPDVVVESFWSQTVKATMAVDGVRISTSQTASSPNTGLGPAFLKETVWYVTGLFPGEPWYTDTLTIGLNAFFFDDREGRGRL
jgi:hypothetical protein